VNKGLLSLAGITLAVAAAVPAHALTTSIANFNQATYNLAQAYPCVVGTYAPALGIADPRVWNGVCTPAGNNNTLAPGTTTPAGAAPGVICLARKGLALDVNCFAVASTANGQFGPCFVQAYRLIKQVPGSFKCPDVYGLPHFVNDSNGNPKLAPYQYFQFGTGVRTWWSLNFTQPGTRFILEVVSVDRAGAVTDDKGNVLAAGGTPLLHNDTWTWRVVADVNTLAYVIELMHGGAVSTLEVPCIIGEDMYDALKAAQSRLAGAVTSGNLTNVGNAIFDFEALIVSNCLFTEILNPLTFFKGPDQFTAPNIQPPGNLAPTVSFATGGTAIAGIIDTLEHPCCCKLLVDLEWITLRQGLVGQTPTLPTF
jgi:hypothetical protein